MSKIKAKKTMAVIMVAIMVIMTGVVQAASLDTSQTTRQAVGTTFTFNDLKYSVTSDTEVALSGLSDLTLTDLTIPNEVMDKGITYTVTSINFSASTARDLKSIVIPQSVTTIGERTFRGCESLTTVTINSDANNPSKLTTIGASAFQSSGITSIVIPQSVTTIGKTAFGYCESLTKVTIPNTLKAPSKLATIDGSAFAWSKLESIIIPQSVETIGGWAFMACTSLADVTIQNEVGAPSKLQTIDQNAFVNTALTSIVIPQSVEKIGDYAFYSCKTLTDVTIKNEAGAPSKLTTISANAFNTSGLTSIVIPQSVTSIGKWAFLNCKALTTATITNTEKSPSQLGTIGGFAFAFSGLESITIPQNVTSIDECAFHQCANLSVLVFSNATSVPTFGASLFKSTDSDVTIYVPFVQKAEYVAAINTVAVLEGYVKALTVSGYGELVLPESALKDAEIGTDNYSQSIAATGGVEGEVTHKIVKGALPEGLIMDANGNITGTPTKLETATFTVTATVANAVANLNYCAEKEYTIKTEDTIAPTLTIKNTEVTIELNGNITEAKFFELVGFTTTDNSKGEVKITTDFDTVAQNALGEKTVKIVAEDASGNKTEKTVTVNVTDTLEPVLSIKNSEVTIELNGNITEADFLALVGVSTTDNSDADVKTRTNNAGVTITTDFANVKQNAVGKTTVTITATDESGNFSTATITVNVTDTTPEPTTEEPTTVQEETTATNGTDVKTGDTLVTPLFIIIALFSVMFILTNRKKEELQG